MLLAYKDTMRFKMANDISHFGTIRFLFSSLSWIDNPDQLRRPKTSSDHSRWFKRWSSACHSTGICQLENKH